MIPVPAIDLKGGKVVRLLQGKFDSEKIYDEKPEAVAKAFEAGGAQRIHVVDLDGALKGEPKNLSAVEQILKAVRVPVEVGGGIRDLKQASQILGMGARWVVFGTKACLDAGFLAEAVAELDERAIIGIDAKDGFVAVDGWTRVLSEKAVHLAKKVRAVGGRTIIYTDISRDGALRGPNLEHVEALAGAVSLDIIASGGVSSVEDLRALRALEKTNLIGVIVGKALYEKKFTIQEAVRACSPNG